MKKIFIIFLTSIFISNISYSIELIGKQNECNKFGVLEIKKRNACLAKSGNEPSKIEKKSIGLVEKILPKINMDSSLLKTGKYKKDK